MPIYTYSLKLQGHAKDDKPSLKFIIDGADEAAALASALDIRTAYAAISTLNVRGESLSREITPTNDARPSDPAADGFEEARVSVYLDATGDKLHTLRIPGAIPALYLPDGQTVDSDNPLLEAYVNELSLNALVSDGESINTTITDGIKEGWKGSRAKTFKS